LVAQLLAASSFVLSIKLMNLEKSIGGFGNKLDI